MMRRTADDCPGRPAARTMCAMRSRSFHLIAASLLIAGCTGYTDPEWRGSLIDLDLMVVPEGFRGNWAAPRDACRPTDNYGARMLVRQNAVGEARVTRVRGYADDTTTVLLELSGNGERSPLRLELSNNGRKLRARRPQDPEPTLFHRCP